MSNRLEQSPDDRLEALGRVERRRLLLRLSSGDSSGDPRVEFDEWDRREGELDPLVAMRHLHLPQLEDGGFVRWDRENEQVTRGPRFEEMEPLLDLLREINEELPGRWV